MKRILIPLFAAASLILTGCFIVSTKPLIPAGKAAFPLELEAGESKRFRHCEQDEDDPQDWSKCEMLSIARNADHYLFIGPDGDEDTFEVRFGILHRSAAIHAARYVLQIAIPDDEEDQFVYGLGHWQDDRFLIALPVAADIPQWLCADMGAVDPTEENDCLKAMDDYDDLLRVIDEVEGVAQFSAFLEAVTD